MCSVSASGSTNPYPPVSTSSTNLPSIYSGAEIRSRVTPGISCTIEIRRPTSAFSKLLLPTFGLPTIATVGIVLIVLFEGDRGHLAMREEDGPPRSTKNLSTKGTKDTKKDKFASRAPTAWPEKLRGLRVLSGQNLSVFRG